MTFSSSALLPHESCELLESQCTVDLGVDDPSQLLVEFVAQSASAAHLLDDAAQLLFRQLAIIVGVQRFEGIPEGRLHDEVLRVQSGGDKLCEADVTASVLVELRKDLFHILAIAHEVRMTLDESLQFRKLHVAIASSIQ
eukprot:CAMPEP_0180438898 /NCGR_PEP_ID=MMETSP1036_2-20121128/12306_1 /TAXON_ID=632150 /ORGANISM="Azadinium spinosum, Strain 3D9" /LENGTH=139 /DNA_ID=CAMNT_0022445013 /DNA_START=72 /DNA_END=491 /DNA_ORIENTATION=+